MFFITSNDENVNKVLNEYRLQIIKQKIDTYSKEYSEAGLFLYSMEKSAFLPTRFDFKEKVKLAKENKFNTILLQSNVDFINLYSKILYNRIKELLEENKFDINFLYFGYTDEKIVGELCDELYK